MFPLDVLTVQGKYLVAHVKSDAEKNMWHLHQGSVNGLKLLKNEEKVYAFDPLYFEEAKNLIEWQIAIKKEMQSIEKNPTW